MIELYLRDKNKVIFKDSMIIMTIERILLCLKN